MTKRRDVLRGSGTVLGLVAAGGVAATGSAAGAGDGQSLELLPAESALDDGYRMLVRVAVGDLDDGTSLGIGRAVLDAVDGVDRSAVEAVATGRVTSGGYRLGAVVGSFGTLEPGERTGSAGDWRLGDDGRTAYATADGRLVFVRGGDGRTDVAKAAVAAARDRADGAVDAVENAGTTADRLSENPFVYHVVLGDGRSGMPGTDDLAALGAGFEAAPGRFEKTTEQEYLLYPEDGVELGTEQAKDIVREAGAGRITAVEVAHEDGVVVATATARRPPEYSREAAPDARVKSLVDRERGVVSFEHAGGEAIDAADLQLWVDGELAGTQPADEGDAFAAGDAVAVETDALATLTLRWFDEEQYVQHVYDTVLVGRDAFQVAHDADAGTVELTYVGERPADPSKLHVRHRSRDGAGDPPQFADEYDELTAGDALTVDGVAYGDRLALELDVPPAPGRSPRTLVSFHARPPRAYLYRRPEEGLVLAYRGEKARDADQFRLLVDGEPADTQPADVTDRLAPDDEIELGDPPVGSRVVLEWLEPPEPLEVAETVVEPHLRVAFDYDGETGRLTVRHEDGDTVDVGALELRVDGEPDEGFAADRAEFGPGDEYTTEVAPFRAVELAWRGPESVEYVLGRTVTGHGSLRASYDHDAGSVQLTYVGDQPADPGRLGVRVTDGEYTHGDDYERPFAAAHDTLTSGDSVTVEGVDPDGRVEVLLVGDDDARYHHRLLVYTPAPRGAFDFESRDGEVVLAYDGDGERDAGAFRVLADGEPAAVQPADRHGTLAAGDEVALGSFDAGTELVVEWVAPDDPVAVAEHTVVPDAEFEASYDADDETVTVEHVGGDAVDAADLALFVRPGHSGPAGWGDSGTVSKGDSTTVAVDEAPEVVFVVFQRSALVQRLELGE